MNTNFDKNVRLIESHIFDDYGDYTGNNQDEECYYLESGEFALPKDNEELFSNLDNDECLIISIKDLNRFAFKGNYNPTEVLAFLTEYSFLENSDIYIFSKNNFDVDDFNYKLDKISNSVNIVFNDYSDEKEDVSIDMLEDSIKISTGHGIVESIALENEKKKTL